jgi:hypothetical protein
VIDAHRTARLRCLRCVSLDHTASRPTSCHFTDSPREGKRHVVGSRVAGWTRCVRSATHVFQCRQVRWLGRPGSNHLVRVRSAGEGRLAGGRRCSRVHLATPLKAPGCRSSCAYDPLRPEPPGRRPPTSLFAHRRTGTPTRYAPLSTISRSRLIAGRHGRHPSTEEGMRGASAGHRPHVSLGG